MTTAQTPPTPAAYRALVIDDERSLTKVIREYLERDGFTVREAWDGLSGLAAVREFDPEVVILDLGLPGLDGIELCRELRRFSDCYVIMLTARGDEVDKLVGLSVGADDYLTKPFSMRELVARIKVMLRRPRSLPTPGESPGASSAPISIGAITIDSDAWTVTLDGAPVELTPTEFHILAALANRPNLVLSRRQLVDLVWGEDWFGEERLVDVHVGRLRRKLRDHAGDPRYIITVRGVGYRMGAG
ncbi:response regulator transcription factor [Mycolicibacterium brumae]|uniref:DNA-binding response regulator n=1 Tax=Mycolicibacterium brumae TaxID=85968 RepID=A0A2G5PFI6_9MYCO|nr:response regulator transcription factor [Mycolicibacterium brumae]MCV7191905.1 response regulator transcription factor [Mycolicibacterium brumae]PIB76880.1 DNA-binding response regulator [Mycolicibacterium brumae]RWA20577.1 hypothetical protein MBRU_02655 [Mycolicibacterium brumae DSM 44177]UWW07673.1 response regulator transcription factor [Mycolicibacterium brumae]